MPCQRTKDSVGRFVCKRSLHVFENVVPRALLVSYYAIVFPLTLMYAVPRRVVLISLPVPR